jgi:hypothetical protein
VRSDLPCRRRHRGKCVQLGTFVERRAFDAVKVIAKARGTGGVAGYRGSVLASLCGCVVHERSQVAIFRSGRLSASSALGAAVLCLRMDCLVGGLALRNQLRASRGGSTIFGSEI